MIPKVDKEYEGAKVNTALHEFGHSIDYGPVKGIQISREPISSQNVALQNVAQTKITESDVGNDVWKIIGNYHEEIDKVITEIDAKYQSQFDALEAKADSIPFSKYSSQWNAIERKKDEEKDLAKRNASGAGMDGFEDIYDALSHGSFSHDGMLKYGHGVQYYSQLEKRERELTANYLSLSITRPDLIEVLRKDQPELVKAMDSIVDELASRENHE